MGAREGGGRWGKGGREGVRLQVSRGGIVIIGSKGARLRREGLTSLPQISVQVDKVAAHTWALQPHSLKMYAPKARQVWPAHHVQVMEGTKKVRIPEPPNIQQSATESAKVCGCLLSPFRVGDGFPDPHDFRGIGGTHSGGGKAKCIFFAFFHFSFSPHFFALHCIFFCIALFRGLHLLFVPLP